MFSDNRQIGAGLTGAGTLFMLLGILLLFDTFFLTAGNLLFLCGITLLIGAQKTVAFFTRPHKRRGAICFFLGIVLVLARWSVVGMLIEVFGILNLFGNFFPVVLTVLRNLPIIGTILNHPFVTKILDKFTGATLPTRV